MIRKIIIGQSTCQNCKMLKMSYDNADYVELEPAQLLALATKLGIKSLPIVVCTGDIEELKKVMDI